MTYITNICTFPTADLLMVVVVVFKQNTVSHNKQVHDLKYVICDDKKTNYTYTQNYHIHHKHNYYSDHERSYNHNHLNITSVK